MSISSGRLGPTPLELPWPGIVMGNYVDWSPGRALGQRPSHWSPKELSRNPWALGQLLCIATTFPL